MRKIAIGLVLLAQPCLALAQKAPPTVQAPAPILVQPAPTPAPSPIVAGGGTIATARKLTALLHLTDQYDRMFEPLPPVLVASILPAMEKDGAVPANVRAELATAEGKARVGRIVGEELIKSFRARYPEMAEETARQYAAAFSEDELQALVAFYSSGAGAKALLLIPQLSTKLQNYGQRVGIPAGREAYGEVLRRLDPMRTS